MWAIILWIIFLVCCLITLIYEYYIPKAEKKKWENKKIIEKDPNEIKKIISSKQQEFNSLAKENEIKKRKKRMEELIKKHIEVNDSNRDLGFQLSSSSSSSNDKPLNKEEIESETQRIIREQDLEYLESLELDKLIENDKKKQKEKEEKLKKDKQDRINYLKSNSKEEPLNGIKLLIKLPNGSSYQRKFLINDKIQDIVDFIDLKEELKLPNYFISTNYPKTLYKDLNLTLEESNIISPTTLYIIEK